MKKILALILTAVLSVSLCAPAGAAHVTATEAISTLETLGLVKGTGSGFEPERTATRAEAVTMLVRLLGREDAALRATGWCPFSDAGWAAKYITYAYNSGLVTGQAPGWFGSAADVQIRDYLTMLLRALGYSTATGDFTWAGSIAFADSIGLTHGEYTAQTPMLREDLALTSYTALTMKMKNSERTLIEQLYLDGAVSASALKATRLSYALAAEKPVYSAAEIHEKSVDAMFLLNVYETEEDLQHNRPFSNSTGFFVTGDGVALTCWHSIDGAAYARATAADGKCYDVTGIIFYDALWDIAVLRVSRTDTEGATTRFFPYLDLGDSDSAYTGEQIYTVSDALGRIDNLTDGLISNAGRVVDDPAYRVLQITAPISGGSSGGALLNAHGEVIGVLYGSFVNGENMNLAVPVNVLSSVAFAGEGMSFAEFDEAEQAKMDASTLKASDITVSLAVDEEKEIVITHDCPRPITIYYEIEDSDIVSCEWGDFTSKFTVPLRICALERGTTEIEVRFADGKGNPDAVATIHVNVS